MKLDVVGMQKYSRANIIAEIGCNHMGKLENAISMIDAANECGVKWVKFQKRHPRSLLSPEQYAAPHPNPQHSFGSSYGEHREYLELNISAHSEIKSYCDTLGLVYSTSVWDIPSFCDVKALDLKCIKIPSAMNTNVPLLSLICEEFPGEIHVSLGMTTYSEECELMALLAKHGRCADVVLYACVSAYPVDPSFASLLEISRIKRAYSGVIKDVGYSGHHIGVNLDVAAYTLGATHIERHFTLNRTWKGTDHSASLDQEGLALLLRALTEAHDALKFRDSGLDLYEMESRVKLKWGKSVL